MGDENTTGASPSDSNSTIAGLFDDAPTDTSNSGSAQTGSDAGGNQSPAPATETTSAQPSAPAAPQPPAQPVASPTLPVQQNISLTPEQLKQLAETVRGPIAQTNTPVAEPSPEDIDKQFGVVRPTEETLSAIFRGGPEGVKAFQETLHATAAMGAKIAAHHAVDQMKKLQEWVATQLNDFKPIKEAQERSAVETHTQQFHQTYPHWEESHKPLLKTVYNKLLAEGFKGTAQEVYAKINEEALSLIRPVVGANFGAAANSGTPANNGVGNQPTAAKNTNLPQSQMTALPMGGSGGSKAASGSSAGKSGPEALFS